MNRRYPFMATVGSIAALMVSQQALPQQGAPSATPAGQPANAELSALGGYWHEPRPAGRRGGGPPGGPPGAGRAGGPPPGAGGPGGPGGPDGAPAGARRGGGPGALVRTAAMGHMLPWAAKRLEEYDKALAAGGLPRTNANQCLPWAVPGIGIPGGIAYGSFIVTAPDAVVFMYELDHQARIVYLDQPHPAKLTPSYFGHSVGHWDGATLTVDSVGFNDKTEIFDGIGHTNALHVVEKLRVTPAGLLEDQVTFEDPGAFTAPITYTQLFERGQPFQEYVCAENNQEAEK